MNGWNLPQPALWLPEEILCREGLENSIGVRIKCEAYSGWSSVEDPSTRCDELRAEAQMLPPGLLVGQGLRHLSLEGVELVELVTRKLPAPCSDTDDISYASLEEIGGCIDASAGRAPNPPGCIINETCGLHCQVGVAGQDGSDKFVMFPLDVLQHLCCTLIQYETVISRSFPHGDKERTTGKLPISAAIRWVPRNPPRL